jgi:hypothetical protein
MSPPSATAAPPERSCVLCWKPLRSDNATGYCHLCQRAHRTTRTCACGRPIGARCITGRCRACFGTWVRVALCSQENADDPVVNVDTLGIPGQ